MRRIDDGKLLRQFQAEPHGADEDTDVAIRAKAPAWTRCAQTKARAG
jgi:hypothetical protein